MEQKGNLLIRDLWQKGTSSVHDMRVVNTGAKYYTAKTPETCLHNTAKTKNKMYLETCIQKRRKFSPFAISVDGLLDVESEATLKRMAIRIETQ